MRAGSSTVVAARRAAVTSGIVQLLSKGVRPCTMGGALASGRAATYRLPHREPEFRFAAQAWYCSDDVHVPGMWRIYSDQLRNLIDILSAAEFAIFLLMHAAPHDRNGALNANVPRKIRPDDVGLSPRACDRAIQRMRDDGFLVEAVAPAGRRRATYRLADAYAVGVPWVHSERKEPRLASPSSPTSAG